MTFNRSLNPLRFYTNIPLCDRCAAMLQQPLYQRNIVSIGFINLRGVPLAEAVGADLLKAQIFTDNMQLLLDCSCGDREHQIISLDTVPQTVVFNILGNDQRNGEHSVLAGFMLHDFQMVAISVPDNIARTQFYDITDAQPY